MALKPSKRRAVAEVISSLLLVVITVVGAVILTSFLDEAFVSGSLATTSTDISTKSIRLFAYDTRDSEGLLGIPNLDNKLGDDVLLGESVSGGNEDNIPFFDGTEFLAIQIENQSLNSVWLQRVNLDGVRHVWDSDTAGIQLDTLTNDGSGDGKYPDDGKFSLMPLYTGGPSPTQFFNTEIEGGQTVILLVKLSSDSQDITLNQGIRVLLNIGQAELVDFVIESGDAR